MADELERRLAARAGRGNPAFDADAFRTALGDRAERAGLLDVAVGSLDSPLGALTAMVTDRGLLRLSYPGEGLQEQLAEVAQRVSPRVLPSASRTDPVRRQLDEYFAGRRTAFDIPIDWRLVRGFAGAVLAATARIPFGAVSSYREIAADAGSPHAYRAAGNALGSNPVPIVVPCHRVLHAGGGLGGYTGGLDRKRFLLQLEGVLRG
jgi:methylated-DNA-[protein]-cysteine S-methyltransferase